MRLNAFAMDKFLEVNMPWAVFEGDFIISNSSDL